MNPPKRLFIALFLAQFMVSFYSCNSTLEKENQSLHFELKQLKEENRLLRESIEKKAKPSVFQEPVEVAPEKVKRIVQNKKRYFKPVQIIKKIIQKPKVSVGSKFTM